MFTHVSEPNAVIKHNKEVNIVPEPLVVEESIEVDPNFTIHYQKKDENITDSLQLEETTEPQLSGIQGLDELWQDMDQVAHTGSSEEDEVDDSGLIDTPEPTAHRLTREEIIAKYTTQKDFISTAKSSKDIDSQIKAHALLKYAQENRALFSSKTREVNAANLALVEEKKKLEAIRIELQDSSMDEMQQIVEELEENKLHPAVCKPLEDRLKRLQNRRRFLTTEYARQQQIVKRVWNEMLELDRIRDDAKQEVYKFMDLEKKIEQDIENDRYEQTVLVQHRQDAMEKTVKDLVTREQKKLKILEEQAEEQRLIAEERHIAELRHAQSDRAVSLRESMRENDKQLAIFKELAEEEKIAKVRNLMTLKKNTENAMVELASKNEHAKKRAQKKEKSRAKERVELIGMGRNPNAVFGVRDEKEKQDKQKEKLRKHIHTHQLEILDKLVHEDFTERKEAQAKYEAEQVKVRYLQKMSRSIIEQDMVKMGQKQKRKEEAKAKVTAQEEKDGNDEEVEAIDIFASIDTTPLSDDDSGPEMDTDTAARLDKRQAQKMLLDPHGAVTKNISILPKKVIPVAFNEVRKKLLDKKNKIALEQAKERLAKGKKLIVCGKEYTNSSKFLSVPNIILFEDFSLGETMKLRIELTNVSFTFNTFKVLAIDQKYIDFFTITYDKVGRMSAGTKTYINIEFTPRLLQDIETVLPLLAETGPFSIPLRCYTKKVKVSLSNDTLDFGSVIRGETKKDRIIIKNDGALGTSFTCNMTNKQGIDVNHLSMSVINGYIKPFSTFPLPFQFSPQITGEVSYDVSVDFQTQIEVKQEADDENPFHHKQQKKMKLLQFGTPSSFQFHVKADAIDVPVYIENDIVDFKCCAYNRLYRGIIRLHNRSTHAHKITMNVPQSLKGCLTFSPNVCFIQSHSSFDVQCKFVPEEGVLERAEKYGCVIRSNDTEEKVLKSEPQIDTEVSITVHDQVLPVLFRIQAYVTSSILEFSNMNIHFGSCFLNQAISVPITVTNHSPLLQKFVFVNLPIEFDVFPDEGLYTLLPYRSCTVNVIFKPRSTTDHNAKLTVRTEACDEYVIYVEGKGVKPKISFEYQQIKFPAVPNGEEYRLSTYVKNTSKSTKIIQLMGPDEKKQDDAHDDNVDVHIPQLQLHDLDSKIYDLTNTNNPSRTEESFVKIYPQLLELAPNESTRVEIIFNPKIQLDKPDDDEIFETVEEDEIEELRVDTQSTESTTRKHNTTNKNAPRKKKMTVEELKQEEERKVLEAETQARIHARNEAKRRLQRIKELELIDIESAKKREKEWKKHPANSLAPFSFVEYSDRDFSNGNEPWSRHASHRIPVFYKTKGKTEDNNQIMYIQVQTTIVLPEVVAVPSELDFGEVNVGHTITKSFQLKNLGIKPTDKFCVKMQGLHSPFHILNAVRALEPNDSQIIVVRFWPKKVTIFSEKLDIYTLTKSISITLTGRCVNSKIEFTPINRILDVGDVMVGEVICRSIKLKNISEFPFSYSFIESFNYHRNAHYKELEDKIERGERHHETNWLGRDAFIITPGSATIAPFQELIVTVSFQPDHASSHYGHVIFFGDYRFQLKGRAHAHQLYILGGEKDESIEAKYANPLGFLNVNHVLFPLLHRNLNNEETLQLSNKDSLRNQIYIPSASGIETTLSGEKRNHNNSSGRERKSKGGNNNDSCLFRDLNYLDFPSETEQTQNITLILRIDEELTSAREHTEEKKDAKKSKKKASVNDTLHAGDDDVNEDMVGLLTVGACEVHDGTKNCEGIYEIVIKKTKDSQYFSVDGAMTGKLQSGLSQNLIFVFSVDHFRKDSDSAALLDFTGQWVCAEATISLKGGVNPTSVTTQTSNVLLKAFVE